MARNKFWIAAPLLAGSLAAVAAVAVSPAASASVVDEVRYTVTDDAYTSSSRKTVNFGQSDKLVAGRISGDVKVSYLKFSVGKLAGGTTLIGAELVLRTDGHAVPGAVRAATVADTRWTEGRITYSNAPKAGAVIASASPGTATTVKLDVSKVVKGAGVYSFAVSTAATNDAARFLAREYGSLKDGGAELRLTFKRAGSTPTAAPTTSPSPKPSPSPTTAPSPSPTTAPTPSPTTVPSPGGCTVDAKLIPSCGVLWGAAAGGFSSTPRDQALKEWETASGRTSTIFHAYHKGDEVFPTKAEIAMTKDPARPRVLFLNWKVAYNTTWAKVAAGGQDARIDKFAAHLKANFTQPFFLAPHHEPENDVNNTSGSGMTAKDFAAMYRYVVERLQRQGVTNAVNVVAYMGSEKWMAQSWWNDLYPGDSTVDWIGLDSYVSVDPGTYHYGTFADLLDRKAAGGVGFYDWAVAQHRTKPIIVAEWAAYHSVTKTLDKSPAFNSVASTLRTRPAVKALVAFDAVADDEGDRNLTINSSPESLASFKKLAADPIFEVNLR